MTARERKGNCDGKRAAGGKRGREDPGSQATGRDPVPGISQGHTFLKAEGGQGHRRRRDSRDTDSEGDRLSATRIPNGEG